MSLKTSADLLPPSFVDVGTLKGMSEVAVKMALIRRYVGEIRRIENILLKKEVSNQRFNLAMKETAKFAKICALKSDDAIKILETMKSKIIAYARRIQDATD